jgi:hypothetical protein
MRIVFFIALSLLAITFDSDAQISDSWKVGSDMASIDRDRIFEAPNGNLILARMDYYYGNGIGIDEIRCYSPEGVSLWSYSDADFLDNSASNFIDIDFDSESNVYVVGSNFPQSASYQKSEVIKFSPSGEELWRIDFTQQIDWAEEVFEIEITADDRIFLLATLFNASASTIITHFVEIDDAGQTLNMIPDLDWELGYAQLFDFGDGFLYTVDQQRATKLNLDGSIVWQADFDFGANYITTFEDERIEYLVEYRDGFLYAAVILNEPDFTFEDFGLVKVDASGQIETHVYGILPEYQELWGVNPLFLEMDSGGNFYVVGDYSNGNAGPTVDDILDERGGPGEPFSGIFIQKIDAGFNQLWLSEYPFFPTDPYGFPTGTFFANDKLAVIFQYTTAGGFGQMIECLSESIGSVIWSDLESSNGVNEQSEPHASIISSAGALYICGKGINSGQKGEVSRIYLYKYELSPVGIEAGAMQPEVVVYPNPAIEYVSINQNHDYQYVDVIDQTGRILLQERMSFGLNRLNIQSLEEGVYMMKLTGNDVQVIHFVKAK